MKYLSLLLVLCFALSGHAQKGVVNNGAKIIVENGAYIKVQGDNTTGYTNKSFGSKHGRIDLDGEIHISGHFNNNASANAVFINHDGTGTVVFNGASTQQVGGTLPIQFEGVMIDGAGLNLDTDITILGTLNLTQGLLEVNSNILTFGNSSAISGTPGATAMIIPGANGVVRKNFNSAQAFTFEIGDNAGSVYIPAVVDFSSGSFTGAYLELQMTESKHPENSNTTDYLNRYWQFSPSGISGFSADLSLSYADADIAGTESNLSTLRYDGNFWDVFDAANTGSNQLVATVSAFGEFTGGGADAVSPQLYWSVETTIEENMEDGHIIKASIVNDEFQTSLNDAQWSISGLPAGVSLGGLNRTHVDTVEITLSGNREDDYDSDITIDLNIHNSQFVHLATGSLNAENSLIIDAENDAENLTMNDDGSIIEGSEDGEPITVTLTGGTFAQSLNTGSWSAINMPDGVSLGTITRESASTVTVILSGNATSDYDMDITNFELTVPASDVNEYSGSDFILNTGVTFKAIDEDLIISMTDGGSGIDESAENGHQITVSIDERVFADPLNQNEWTMYNLPSGVTIGSVTRQNDTAAYIFLSGNRNVDYDTDITNTELTIGSSQIGGVSNQVTLTSGVTFNALNDPEVITIADDGDGITEGMEDGEIITATIAGGTFADPPQIAYWTLDNLPDGVTIGDLTRNSMLEVEILLSGNRETDFDSDITNVSLTVAANDVDDTDVAITSNNNLTVSAINDDETLALSGGPFTEGNEDGQVITATLSGGTISSAFTSGNLTVTDLPQGVSVGSVVRENMQVLTITLEGNATIDYDSDITNVTATIDAAVVDETSSDISGTGVTFVATVEEVELLLSDNGNLYESEEDGKELIITVREDTFISTIDPGAFTFFNLPGGVTAGSITKLNDTVVSVILSGNREVDYDTNITDAGVDIASSEFVISTDIISANSGWTFIATDDAENIGFTADLITEGAEDGAEIDIVISGGTFVDDLDVGHWSFTGLPAGVMAGSINKLSPNEAVITLSGNASADYDSDIIVDELIVDGNQFDDYDMADLAASGAITFDAIVETQDLNLTSAVALDESNLDGAALGLKLQGADFSTPVDPANFVLNNYPPGLTKGTLTLESSDSVSLELAFDGSDFDVDYPDFNVTLLAAGSSIGEQVNSNVLPIAAILEPGDLQISHAGLTEENLDGAVIDLTLIDDSFADNVLDPANFTLMNAPDGCIVNSVDYISGTSATLTMGYSGTDFDTDFQDFAITMEADEVASGNIYTSNTLQITATNDPEVLSFVDPVTIMEGSEDGNILEVEISGGNFVDMPDPQQWSFSWLPDGTTINDVLLVNENLVEVLLVGNRIEDYDNMNQVSLEISPDQYHDAGGSSLMSDNSITFDAYNETLEAMVDTLFESTLDETEVHFTLTDDWLVSPAFSAEDISLQTAITELLVEEVIVTDSANFTVALAYTGSGISQNEAVTFEIADSVLFGLESLVSQEITVANDVGINDHKGIVDLYVSENEIYLKQHQIARKGSLLILELNGRRLDEYRVEAKSTNIFAPVIPDGMYLIQFISDNGKIYQTKGVVKN